MNYSIHARTAMGKKVNIHRLRESWNQNSVNSSQAPVPVPFIYMTFVLPVMSCIILSFDIIILKYILRCFL